MIDCKNDCPRVGKGSKYLYRESDAVAPVACAECLREQAEAAEARARDFYKRAEKIIKTISDERDRAEMNVIRYMPKGNWSRTPPTEPGWYKVRCPGRFKVIELHKANPNPYGKKTHYFSDGEEIIEWYSEKETFPPLPDGEEK